MKSYKPEGYNSISPYFVVNGAQKLINFLIKVFNAKELRRYDLGNGSIMHAEVKIDDSVLMMGDASDKYPANQLLIHVYVQNVDEVFDKALLEGAVLVEKPTERDGDPDRRGAFKDFAGNIWSVSTQRDTKM